LIGLALAMGACGVDYGAGYYEPYYVPDYGDWVFWYDNGDDDWWYPDDIAAAQLRVGSQSFQPMDAASGNDKLQQLKASLVEWNRDVVRALVAHADVTTQRASTAQSSDVQEYGPENLPATNPTATFRLTIRPLEKAKFGWSLLGRPIGTDDRHYKTLLVGTLEQDGIQEKGMAVFNLNNMHALNKVAYPTTGHAIALTANGARPR
jgi:hypothetical protein